MSCAAKLYVSYIYSLRKNYVYELTLFRPYLIHFFYSSDCLGKLCTAQRPFHSDMSVCPCHALNCLILPLEGGINAAAGDSCRVFL